MDYDGLRQLVWTNDGARAWVASRAAVTDAAPQPAPAGAPTGSAARPAQGDKRTREQKRASQWTPEEKEDIRQANRESLRAARPKLIVAGVVVLLLVVGAVGCQHLVSSSPDQMPFKAQADITMGNQITTAASQLSDITTKVTEGNTAQASTDFANEIHAIYPTTKNTYALLLSNHYVDYANAVRYYILGQGGLQQVDKDSNTVSSDLSVDMPGGQQ